MHILSILSAILSEIFIQTVNFLGAVQENRK